MSTRGDTSRRSPVSADALPALGALAAVPGYDRSVATVGVVHIGVGAFHRSHQAYYLDRLMAATGDLRWGICGVGVLEADRAMKEALQAQDGLYTLVTKHGDGTQDVRIVGSLLEYMFVSDGPESVVDRMAADEISMVTLTITEGGYADDVQDETDRPTAFGLIVAALRRRRDRGAPPFAIVSCDNVPGNGRLTRARLTAFARRRDPQLADWIEREVRFPSSMVDRITAATTDADRSELATKHGIEDRWPVVCEPFGQWVLEDDFPSGRPPLEAVGVQVVDDVEPYELAKLRLLNGSHQVLCHLAHLAGHRLVHEAIGDPLLRAMVSGYMDAEAGPTLGPVPGLDLDDYRRTLLERFSNPFMADTIARLCAHSSDRIPAFVLPVVRHQLQTGGEIRRCATAVAAWARYSEGVDEAGEPIEIVDGRRDQLAARSRDHRARPEAFLEDRELFGDLAGDERFVAAFSAAAASLREHGARETVRALLEQTQSDGRPHG